LSPRATYQPVSCSFCFEEQILFAWLYERGFHAGG
jgi:hypothetical protein